MKLSNKQQEIFDDIMHFFLESDEMIYIFSGVAGSGKSTIINIINEVLTKQYNKKVANIALTGKATNVMRTKGIYDAKTIHSFLYIPIIDALGNLTGFKLKDSVCRTRASAIEPTVLPLTYLAFLVVSLL